MGGAKLRQVGFRWGCPCITGPFFGFDLPYVAGHIPIVPRIFGFFVVCRVDEGGAFHGFRCILREAKHWPYQILIPGGWDI